MAFEKKITFVQAAAEFIQTKQKTKYRFPLETLVVKGKCADVNTTPKCNRKNPTDTNVLKFKKAQNESANIYLKTRQTTYKIRLIRLETQLKINNLG